MLNLVCGPLKDHVSVTEFCPAESSDRLSFTQLWSWLLFPHKNTFKDLHENNNIVVLRLFFTSLSCSHLRLMDTVQLPGVQTFYRLRDLTRQTCRDRTYWSTLLKPPTSRLNLLDLNGDDGNSNFEGFVFNKSWTGLNGLSCESVPAPSLTPQQRRQTSHQWRLILKMSHWHFPHILN